VGTPDQGASGAGAGAKAQDAATVFWNPAGMTRLKKDEIMLGFVGAYIDAEFKVNPNRSVTIPPGSTNGGGQAIGFIPLVGTYVVKGITERLKARLAFNGLFGGAADYNNNWVGRTLVTKAELVVLNIEPALGFRLTDWLSLGAGLNILYESYEQKFRASSRKNAPTLKFDGDDWGVAGSFGTLLQFLAGTPIGIFYRTKASIKLKGKVESPIPVKVRFGSDFDFPQGIYVSLFQQLHPQVALLADAGWTDWSEFGYQALTVCPASVNVNRNWRDTRRVAAGLQYKPKAEWLLQTGFSFDSSPVPASDRLPDIPIFEAWRFSVGAQYDVKEYLTVGLAYTFAYLGKGDVDQVELPPNGEIVLDGSYDPNIGNFVGVTVTWKFGPHLIR